MCVHEEQDSTTSFGIFLTWSLWPQRTIFATRANYENLGNDKRLSVELPQVTITMITLISSYASWYAEDYLQREISIPKLINWLKRTGRFAKAIHVGTLDALFIDLWRTLPTLLCKQQRRRRTSRQLIEEYGYYMEDALAA
jgi:hypothetical protein